MTALKALIIDDEPKARRTLATLLSDYCDPVTIVGQAESVQEALQLLKQEKPDVVFLDIDMPVESGFKLFDYVNPVEFHTVFVTAYDQYAIKAFKQAALGYLLKPVQIQELKAVVERCRTAVSQQMRSEQLSILQEYIKPSPTPSDKRIALPVANGFLFKKEKELVCLKADGSYTEIFTVTGERLVISKKLGELEDLLSQNTFYRCHRSYIINLNEIHQFVRESGGYLLLTGDCTATVSKDKREELLQKIAGQA
ncbi:response regulator transcription factor [bacterium SCSIO 12741]|nr:response regulator transcription factor [bacterium SCSIO 12741]